MWIAKPKSQEPGSVTIQTKESSSSNATNQETTAQQLPNEVYVESKERNSPATSTRKKPSNQNRPEVRKIKSDSNIEGFCRNKFTFQNKNMSQSKQTPTTHKVSFLK